MKRMKILASVVAAAAIGATAALVTPADASSGTPSGPGSVSGAPNLPAGFAKTFTSKYVEAGGVRLHVVVGGKGKPLLLIHQPVDYWHQSPSLPDAYWTAQFEIVSCATQAAARAALPRDLSRTAFIGAPFPELLAWGPAAINP